MSRDKPGQALFATAPDPQSPRSSFGPLWRIVFLGVFILAIIALLTIRQWYSQAHDTMRLVTVGGMTLFMAFVCLGCTTWRTELRDDRVQSFVFGLPCGSIQFEKVTDTLYVETPPRQTYFTAAGLAQIVFPYPGGRKKRMAVPKRLVDDVIRRFEEYQRQASS